MLDFIRNKQHTFLIKVIFWTIIAAFVGTGLFVWGGGDSGPNDPTTAATVNKTKIGYDEYQRTYGDLYRLYQQVYQDQFTPALERQLGLRRQALDMLVDQTLLVQEARRRGIDVSRQELVDAIARIPAFQDGGAFNRERYLQVLASQRMTPDAFESAQRRQLLIDKMRDEVQRGVTVTDEEIEKEYRAQSETINLSFLALNPERFEDRVRVSEDDLRGWFDENRESFQRPEAVALKYLLFDPARHLDEVTLEPADLERYYRRNIDLFEIPEQVSAAHILIRVTPDAGEEMVRRKQEQAEKILAQISEGADFGELARKHSDDAVSAARGGDLGFFPRGAMVPAFEQAAFALRPGQISDIVASPFGFHIIKVNQRVEAGLRPMAEAEEEVREGARLEKARQLALEKAMDAYNMNRRGGSLEAAAKANDLEIRKTGFFERQGPVDGLGDAPEIVSAAFSRDEGELARPVSRPEGVLLFAVSERRASFVPELDQVRSEVEGAFRRERSAELARKAAEDALAQLREGKSLSALARDMGHPVEETGQFTRAYGTFIPRLGSAEEIAEIAFDLTSAQPVADRVFEQDGRFVLVVLKERQESDRTALDSAKREELRRDLLARKQSEALDNLINELRSEAQITIAPTIASSLQGEQG